MFIVSVTSLLVLAAGLYCAFEYNIGIFFCLISYFVSFRILERHCRLQDYKSASMKKKVIISIAYFTFSMSFLVAFTSEWINVILYNYGRIEIWFFYINISFFFIFILEVVLLKKYSKK